MFLPEHSCFPSYATDCTGAQTEGCRCAEQDTCGAETGAGCGNYSFGAATLQLAVEWCSSDSAYQATFEGVLRVHEMYLGPLSCDLPG